MRKFDIKIKNIGLIYLTFMGITAVAFIIASVVDAMFAYIDAVSLAITFCLICTGIARLGAERFNTMFPGLDTLEYNIAAAIFAVYEFIINVAGHFGDFNLYENAINLTGTYGSFDLLLVLLVSPISMAYIANRYRPTMVNQLS